MASFWKNLWAPFNTDAMDEAAALKEKGIQQGLTAQREGYGTGRNVLTDYYTRALDPWMNLQGTAGRGYDAYADATGANGLEGLQRARAQFMSDPGLQFGLNEGSNAIARAGVRGGATGNTMQAIQKYATDYGATKFGEYVNRLAPWLGQGTAVAGGISDINRALGGELSRSYTGEGDAAARAYGAIGDVQAQGAMSPYLAGQNIWGGILGLGQIAASAAGGGMGGAAGKLGGNLFSKYSNNFLGGGNWLQGS